MRTDRTHSGAVLWADSDRHPGTKVPVFPEIPPGSNNSNFTTPPKRRSSPQKPSARAYVEKRMSEGLTGDRLGDAVLRKYSDLEDDLPKLGPGDDPILTDEHGTRLSPKSIRNNVIRQRVGIFEQDIATMPVSSPAAVTKQSWDPEDHDASTDPKIGALIPLLGSEGPIRFSNSGVLDTAEVADVTPDWEYLLSLSCMPWYRKMKNSLITKYVDQCYPLDRDDLWMELDISVACALPRFQRVPSSIAGDKGYERPQLRTFLWRVMENRLKNLVRDARRQIQPIPLVLHGDDHGIPNEPVSSPEMNAGLDLRAALLRTPDADLLLMHAAGYPDKAIATDNIRMRRSRAKKRLAQELG